MPNISILFSGNGDTNGFTTSRLWTGAYGKQDSVESTGHASGESKYPELRKRETRDETLLICEATK